MADVFISYSQNDRARVRPIVEALRTLDLTFCFDAEFPTGSDYRRLIDRELGSTKAVMVCWSAAAVGSEWVLYEAEKGLQRKILVPIMIEGCKLVPPFTEKHAEDLSDWKGDHGDLRFLRILERIGTLVERPGLQALYGARADTDGALLAAWAARYKNDPYVDKAWAKAEELQKVRFESDITSIREALSLRYQNNKSTISARIEEIEDDFKKFLSNYRNMDQHVRPDAAKLLSEKIPSWASMGIDFYPKPENEKATKPMHFNGGQRWGAFLGSMLFGVFFGVLCSLGLASSKLSADNINKELNATKEELKLLQVRFDTDVKAHDATDADLKSKLMAAESRSSQADKIIRDLKDKISKEEADFKHQVDAMAVAPVTVVAPEPRQGASDACTANAGSRFDADNTGRAGIVEMLDLSFTTVQDTIFRCKEAIAKSTDLATQRRLRAQLGRAYAVSAVQRKRDRGDDQRSHRDMDASLEALRQSEKEGSAYAAVLLGNYYVGYYNERIGAGIKDFFNTPEPSKALTYFKEAADKDNPIGIVDYVNQELAPDDASSPNPISAIGKFFNQNNKKELDKEYIASRLQEGMYQKYPKAFLAYAKAVLDPRLYLSWPPERRARAAAQAAVLSACYGGTHTDIDAFFKTVKDSEGHPLKKPAPQACAPDAMGGITGGAAKGSAGARSQDSP